MTTKFNPEKTQGYTSTSNVVVKMSNNYLYKIIIPKDAKVIVIDISKEVNQKNVYEIVLERYTRFIQIDNNVLLVKTLLSNQFNMSEF